MARFLPVPGLEAGSALLRLPPLPHGPRGLAAACAVTAVLVPLMPLGHSNTRQLSHAAPLVTSPLPSVT